jgi:DNA-binding response OmpR family regulator
MPTDRLALAPPRLAVIDDDSGFLRVLDKRLDRLGWEHRTLDVPVAVEVLGAMRLSAVVVDVRLAGPAWDVYLRSIAEALPGLGVIVCSGPSSVAERVRGLRAGADDWLGKPCHPEELIARVEAVVRRRRAGRREEEPTAALAGELEIRRDRFQVFVAGRALDLTRREFELLDLLAGADGRVLEREEIYERIWGYTMVRGDRSVDVFVRKVRRKLAQASPGWRYLHTQFGVGYRFAAEPESGPERGSDPGPERAAEAVPAGA